MVIQLEWISKIPKKGTKHSAEIDYALYCIDSLSKTCSLVVMRIRTYSTAYLLLIAKSSCINIKNVYPWETLFKITYILT